MFTSEIKEIRKIRKGEQTVAMFRAICILISVSSTQKNYLAHHHKKKW